ncbi:DUF2844 domain-containing protein [Paraburkholderia solisilvae]|uniref:DUF2844 domain-containing protein n=1 Tax=Paraburkholderia solisilvae TaxID=624376 RepID=A0A6J5DQS5_9BURK|nr:DUF2844 domain-containing protein [Paraburkholderia solisilvae]CAB3755275.1 hypothetical protein LMG29739_02145 [Paraburkholderia solisilvae]
MTRHLSTAACAVAALLLLPSVSHATLGGKPSNSIAVPLAANQPVARDAAAQAPTSNRSYTTHSTHTADGVTVHEYATRSGVVFAVTWSGPVRPDMTALLGSYFPNFASAARRGKRGTGPLIERSGDLQVESIGYQGQFIGKAWVPRLVPAQVDVGDLE